MQNNIIIENKSRLIFLLIKKESTRNVFKNTLFAIDFPQQNTIYII